MSSFKRRSKTWKSARTEETVTVVEIVQSSKIVVESSIAVLPQYSSFHAERKIYFSPELFHRCQKM